MRYLLPIVLGVLLIGSVAEAQNLVPNGSFDHDTSGWSDGSQGIELVFRPDVGNTAGGSGPGCLEVRRQDFTGGLLGPRSERVPVTPGTQLDVRVAYLIPGGANPAGGAWLYVEWYQDNANLDSAYIAASPLDPERDRWSVLSGTVTVPADMDGMSLRVMVSNPTHDPPPSQPGTVLFDDAWASPTGSTEARQVLFVPAAAAANGSHGTYWSTDLWVANRTLTDLTLRGAFLPKGSDNSGAVRAPSALGTVPAGGFLKVPDVVSAVGGSGTGGLYLEASAAGGDLPAELVQAVTYTFTPNPDGDGSYGQGIPAVGSGERSDVLCPGVFHDGSHRTNVGVLNTSDQSIVVGIAVIDAQGSEAGSGSWTLPPYSQRQESVGSFGVTGIRGGTVRVTRMDTTPGGAFMAFISVVDNDTGDAVYIEGR